MNFHSITFAIFLPVVFLIYWELCHRVRVQNLFIIAVSYLFYGWWDRRFLLLIFLCTLSAYGAGLTLGRLSGRGARRVVLWSEIVLNVGVLVLFKYFNFFSESLQALFAGLGWHFSAVTLQLVLPVGISFYTLQAMGYVIDVYRRHRNPARNPIPFFAFISFFPQLVAGPIERATNMLPQFERARRFDYRDAVEGCRIMLWGFFKKMVVADSCALLVNANFKYASEAGGLNFWIAAIAFAFQIYGDFSGYSDIATGTARLFGIRLMTNFRTPYFSRDLAEFWRRWHISLNTWFVDYIYIPLGGNRHGRLRTAANSTVVFLLCGLWHGAAATFVLWGAYNAMLFVPLALTGKTHRYKGRIAPDSVMPSLHDVFAMGVTFLLVCVGWVFFRAWHLENARIALHAMFSNLLFVNIPIPSTIYILVGVSVVCMLMVEWINRHKEYPFSISEHGLLRFRPMRWGVYLLIAVACITLNDSNSSFIYFQF